MIRERFSELGSSRPRNQARAQSFYSQARASNEKDLQMKKMLSIGLAVSAFALAAMVSTADARGPGGGGPGGGGPGASSFAPGQAFRSGGPTRGYPGASGYAPGRMNQPSYNRGPRSYAPGRIFRRR